MDRGIKRGYKVLKNKDEINYMHKDLANGRWAEMPLRLQMGNIGSEVSRAIKAKESGNEKRLTGALERALELYDLSLACLKGPALREVCRAREEFCDYFCGDNEFRTDPVKLQRYYDGFVWGRL